MLPHLVALIPSYCNSCPNTDTMSIYHPSLIINLKRKGLLPFMGSEFQAVAIQLYYFEVCGSTLHRGNSLSHGNQEAKIKRASDPGPYIHSSGMALKT